MVSKEQRQEVLNVWAEAVQDGANEFLELALEMKEAGKEGYEWPYLLGLFADQLAKHIRTGSCAPDMTKAQKTHMAVAVSAFHDGFTKHRNVISAELFDKAEGMFVVFSEILDVFPVKLPEIRKPEPKKTSDQLELPKEADVVVVLPKDTPTDKIERITLKVTELLGKDEVLDITVGNMDVTQVRVRAGSEEKYSTVIDEVLRGHIPVPEHKPEPAEETPQS